MGEQTNTEADDLHPEQELDIHPFAELFPTLEKEAFDSLAESIRRDGLLQPIVTLDGKIIDGRNRYRACRAVNRPLYRGEVQEFHGSEDEALAYVSAVNLERRHLSASQRALIAADMARRAAGRRRADAPASLTTNDAANRLKVSSSLVELARKVKKDTEPHIVDMVRDGSIKLAQAQAASRLDAAAQRKLTTPEAVVAAVNAANLVPRGMGKKTAEALVATIVDAASELAVRGDIGGLAAGIQPKDAAAVLGRLDGALRQLGELRNAVRARVG